MSSIFRPYARRLVPPFSRLKIDFTHPLANGLIGCWVPGVSWGRNLVNTTADMVNGSAGGGTIQVRPEGPVLSTEINTGTNGLSCLTTAPFKSQNEMSIYFRGHRTSLATSAFSFNYPVFIGYDDSGLNSPYFLAGFQANSDWTGLSFNINDGAGGNPTGASYDASAIQNLSLCGSYKVSGLLKLYVSGVEVGSNTSAALAPSSTANSRISLCCWDEPALSRGMYGSCYIACVWNRQLSAAEVALIDADPYGFLISDEGEMPSVFTSVASSFLAAWANQSNLPILGTGIY